jgi:hypothetical protein
MEDKRVDEDWKKKVEEEKRKFSAPQQESKKSGASPGPETGLPDDEIGIPEVSFINFVSGLATQALMALGQVEHPVTKQAEVDLDQAKYLIDIIEMLKGKTQGNRTAEETKTVETLLYNLKMVYVKVSKTVSS